MSKTELTSQLVLETIALDEGLVVCCELGTDFNDALLSVQEPLADLIIRLALEEEACVSEPAYAKTQILDERRSLVATIAALDKWLADH